MTWIRNDKQLSQPPAFCVQSYQHIITARGRYQLTDRVNVFGVFGLWSPLQLHRVLITPLLPTSGLVLFISSAPASHGSLPSLIGVVPATTSKIERSISIATSWPGGNQCVVKVWTLLTLRVVYPHFHYRAPALGLNSTVCRPQSCRLHHDGYR